MYPVKVSGALVLGLLLGGFFSLPTLGSAPLAYAGDTEAEKQELHRQWGGAIDSALGACRSILKGYVTNSNWADYKHYRAEALHLDQKLLNNKDHRSGWEVGKGIEKCDTAIPKAFQEGDCENKLCIRKYEDDIEMGPDSKNPVN